MRGRLIAIIGGLATMIASSSVAVPSAQAPTGDGLTGAQRTVLYSIARDTWRFFQRDVDPVTHLPLDNLGPGSTLDAW